MQVLNPDTEELDSIGTWQPKSAVTYDLDFSSSSAEVVTISLDETVQVLLRGRLYIDTDPGALFSEWADLTFYNKDAKEGGDAFFRTQAKILYDELEVATSGSAANIIPDDHTEWSPNDLVLIDYTEYARLKTIADTMVAEDNVGAYSINDSLAKVIEIHNEFLWNLESENEVHFKVAFDSAQTVSLKFEIILMERV